DRDGDLDLFVGGRVVPGKYPLPARSSLLINDGKGRFAEGADTLAKGLADAGLVTGALWSDADGDGWLDLL
ncbi:MAG: VCBS repeat-containing protein, partial [Verrucomicrobiae bacterium]|nr:VCBS repeat-containing protein [Verrucomicrobiae bacterium]